MAQILKHSLQCIYRNANIDVSYVPDKTHLQFHDLVQIIDELHEDKPSLSGNDLCQGIFFCLRKVLQTHDIDVKIRSKLDASTCMVFVASAKPKSKPDTSNESVAIDVECYIWHLQLK